MLRRTDIESLFEPRDKIFSFSTIYERYLRLQRENEITPYTKEKFRELLISFECIGFLDVEVSILDGNKFASADRGLLECVCWLLENRNLTARIQNMRKEMQAGIYAAISSVVTYQSR